MDRFVHVSLRLKVKARTKYFLFLSLKKKKYIGLLVFILLSMIGW